MPGFGADREAGEGTAGMGVPDGCALTFEIGKESEASGARFDCCRERKGGDLPGIRGALCHLNVDGAHDPAE